MTEEKNRILPGTLYLVATPIGNLEDITLRALKVLSGCDFIAAEDTRVTAKLLAAYTVKKPMITYEEHSKRRAGETILRRLSEGESCALVTDAGTPGISDPGEDIARLCIENGFCVVPIPGPCAAVTGLIASGFSTRRFVFEGFLEGSDRQKRERLADLKSETRTVILYEAPHRLSDTISLMAEVLGPNRRIAIAREMTKLNEEVLHLTMAEAVDHFAAEAPRGEFILILEGASETAGAFWETMTLKEHVAYYVDVMGQDKMAAVKSAARDRGLPKNEVYRALLEP